MVLKIKINASVQHSLHVHNGAISQFAAYPTLVTIKSNIYFLTHQYSIINYSQSKRALSAQFYGYISLLADKTVLFYLECGGADHPIRDIRAYCYLCSNLYQVAWFAKFAASVQQLHHASHRVKCKRYILGDAQMCAVKCGLGDAFRCVLSQSLWLILTF